MSLTFDALKKLHDNGLFAVPPVDPVPIAPVKPQGNPTEALLPRDPQVVPTRAAAEHTSPTASAAYDPVIHPYDDLRPVPVVQPSGDGSEAGELLPLPPLPAAATPAAGEDWSSCGPSTEQPAADDYDLLLPEPAPDWMDMPEAEAEEEITADSLDIDRDSPPLAAAETAVPAAPTYEQSVQMRLADADYAASFLRLLEGVRSRCGAWLPASLLTVSPHATSRSAELIVHMALLWGGATDKTLLIDANLQEQTLTRNLNALGQPGICDVLSSMALPEDVVRATSLSHLHFVPCGDDQTGISRVAEQIDRDLLERVLQQWCGRYDRVLIDVGPIEATLAQPLAQLCDASLLVVCMRDVALPQLHLAAETLRGCSRQVLGCVLTDAFEAVQR